MVGAALHRIGPDEA